MNPIERLNGKKGLLAIALLMAVVMALPFAAQYYTWRVTYNITPLTSNYMSINIPATSGATSGTYTDTGVPDLVITKAAKPHFRIEADDMAKIVAAFYDLKIEIVDEAADGVGVIATLHPIASGVPAVGTGAPYDVEGIALSPATYDIKAVVTFWTGAVNTLTSDSFIIEVYAVET
jgi:hypothetical protein